VHDWRHGFKVMKPDNEAADPLCSAIRELREELLMWIDNELERLRAGEPAENRRPDDGPATASKLGLPSSRVGASSGRPHLQLGLARQESRSRERDAETDSFKENPRPAIEDPERETDPDPLVHASDPRQRLDALARLLDHRLKQQATR
jgi:hypothetical protein